jgi:phosphate transport system substrate-binding protein
MKKAAFKFAGTALAVSALIPFVWQASASATLTKYKLNSVGSDVTFCASQKVDKAYNTAVKPVTKNKVYDTPPYLSTNIGCETTPATFTVKADTVHPLITYSASNLPPNGGTAGINALIADNGAGNIAFARSTSGRSGSNPANLEFWAYGLDAVSWDHFSSNTSAPATLSAAQLAGIYNCTYTNWNQVGGGNALITRYYPVITSSTASFFAKLFLGGSEPVSTGTCPITFVPQNDATQVASGDRTTSILPYSYGNFFSQTTGVYGAGGNLAAGTVLGEVNGTAASKTTIVEAAAFANISGDACTATPVAGQFCGSRYIYNVTWQKLPALYYDAVIDLIGVPSTGTAGANSYCSDKYKSTLTTYGFVPLAKATTAQSTSSDPVPGSSYCRQF